MKKVLIVIGILLVAGVIAFFLFGDNYGKLMKEYGSLVEPRVTEYSDQKMLEYKGTGDPNHVAKAAFQALFKGYYSLKGVDKMKGVAPKARWPEVDVNKKGEWVGFYGVPVPESVTELPAGLDPNVKLTTWKYGQVAEILHVGPYAEETANIEKLQKFIKDSGYKINGAHEEEYVKGPGMFGAGNTKKYLTIIRYQVVKTKR